MHVTVSYREIARETASDGFPTILRLFKLSQSIPLKMNLA
jgi:hypothetical protein